MLGDTVSDLGILLQGKVNVLLEDFDGNRNIVTVIEPGMVFAESYACVPQKRLEVSVQAAENAEVMWIETSRILGNCGKQCDFHRQLIQNLTALLAHKNLLMNQKLTILTRRSTREKLLTYLYGETQKQQSHDIRISLNRQQLADFLSIDRSAMSAELSKLQKEGILDFHKNHFIIYECKGGNDAI